MVWDAGGIKKIFNPCLPLMNDVSRAHQTPVANLKTSEARRLPRDRAHFKNIAVFQTLDGKTVVDKDNGSGRAKRQWIGGAKRQWNGTPTVDKDNGSGGA